MFHVTRRNSTKPLVNLYYALPHEAMHSSVLLGARHYASLHNKSARGVNIFTVPGLASPRVAPRSVDLPDFTLIRTSRHYPMRRVSLSVLYKTSRDSA